MSIRGRLYDTLDAVNGKASKLVTGTDLKVDRSGINRDNYKTCVKSIIPDNKMEIVKEYIKTYNK